MKKTINSSPLTRRLLIKLGENIKFARLRRNLPIKLVAERAGIAINTYISLEKGNAGVSIGALANVLHALGLAQDIEVLAKDDILGRNLQDLNLITKKRASKRTNGKCL